VRSATDLSTVFWNIIVVILQQSGGRGAEIWGFRESIILSGGIHITIMITLLFNLGCTTVRKITIVEYILMIKNKRQLKPRW
jgi:hypothetical protein